MSIQLNQVIVIFFVWIFCLLEDKWFDKILKYQIKGQAEKLGLSGGNAIKFYDKNKSRFLWIILAFALTVILLSFHIDDIMVRSVIIASCVCICFIYLFIKLSTYKKSSIVLNKR